MDLSRVVKTLVVIANEKLDLIAKNRFVELARRVADSVGVLAPVVDPRYEWVGLDGVEREQVLRLFRELSAILAREQEWFEEHVLIPSRSKSRADMEVLLRAEINVLLGLAHADLDVLRKRSRELVEHDADFVGALQEHRRRIDVRVVKLAKDTRDFAHMGTYELSVANELVEEYARLRKECLSIVEDVSFSDADRAVAKRLAESIRVSILNLSPVLRDPHVNPHASGSYVEVMHVVQQLRPCHLVLSKETLFKVLQSGELLSKVQTQTDKERYSRLHKGQRDSVFLSAGGPFEHLPVRDPAALSLIIFSTGIYDAVRMEMYPRDTGGYPDTPERLEPEELAERTRREMEQRRFGSVGEMYEYLFNMIKARGLRRLEDSAIVGHKIGRKGVALFPELVIKQSISLKFAEVIFVSEKVFFSPEMAVFKKKYGEVIQPAQDVFDAYWAYTKLARYLV